jgi:hypothetical protein
MAKPFSVPGDRPGYETDVEDLPRKVFMSFSALLDLAPVHPS